MFLWHKQPVILRQKKCQTTNIFYPFLCILHNFTKCIFYMKYKYNSSAIIQFATVLCRAIGHFIATECTTCERGQWHGLTFVKGKRAAGRRIFANVFTKNLKLDNYWIFIDRKMQLVANLFIYLVVILINLVIILIHLFSENSY